jgi:hypothetical protein
MAHFCSEHLGDFSTYPLATTQIYYLIGALISETCITNIFKILCTILHSMLFKIRAALPFCVPNRKYILKHINY